MNVHVEDRGIAGNRLRCLTSAFLGCLAVTLGAASVAAPGGNTAEREITRTHTYFMERFPDVPLDRYGEGASLTQPASDQLHSRKRPAFTASSHKDLYADCLPENARTHFPRFDTQSNSVKTLRQAINDCRARKGESRLDESDPALDRIEASIAQESAGKKLEIPAPEEASGAQSWFDRGRFLFGAKRGQQNQSCASCHEQYAGSRFGESPISASLSHALRFPAYSASKKELISLHEQYAICFARAGAKPFAPQSDEYKALEYYESVIASGIPLAAPADVE